MAHRLIQEEEKEEIGLDIFNPDGGARSLQSMVVSDLRRSGGGIARQETGDRPQ